MEKSFAQLLALYEAGELSGAELDQFFLLLEKEENRAQLAAAIDEKVADKTFAMQDNKVLTERSVAALRKAMQEAGTEVAPVHRMHFFRKWGWAAASVLLLLAAGTYLLTMNKKQPAGNENKEMAVQEIRPPQTNRAMITLADGQKIYLDSADNGMLATQGNMQLLKTAEGRISYNPEGGQPLQQGRETVYNTLYNPRGSRIIEMTLADGSHVWLNAESSLTYPVVFNGTERRVTITGEAYFEVSHDAQKPFYVTNNNVTVSVLGTSFNVNTYADEPDVRVTLLQGSVKTSMGNARPDGSVGRGQWSILKPGQQAIVSHSQLTVHHSPDLDQVIAWKNGRFAFGDKVDIRTIMRQIARWYNVDVEVRGEFNRHFGGSISRDANASELFKVLEATGGVRCQVEGNKVVVTPR